MLYHPERGGISTCISLTACISLTVFKSLAAELSANPSGALTLTKINK